MAGIDKTYVSTYEDWKEIIEWAKKTSFKCPNGIVLDVSWYCYNLDLTEEEVRSWISEDGEIPVMNTPEELDYFLIKYCPVKTIQDRMKEVYREEYINSVLLGTSRFDTYQRPTPGKHVKITKKPKSRKNYLWSWINWKGIKKKGCYKVNVREPGPENRHFRYNEDYGTWVAEDELGYATSFGSIPTKARSFKALLRKIKSWGLPVGSIVEFEGMYEEEDGELIIKP